MHPNMEHDFIKILGQLTGIGGVALGVLLLLFRGIIRKLVPAKRRRLVRVSTGMVWAVAAAGALLVVYADLFEQHRPGSLEQTSRDKRPTLGNSRGLAAHPQPSSDLAKAMEEQLRGASLAFNRPERLRYRQTAYIELVLAPEELGVEASTLLTPDLPGVPKQATSS